MAKATGKVVNCYLLGDTFNYVVNPVLKEWDYTITQLVIVGTGPRGLRNGNLFGKRELSARRTIKQVPLDEIKEIVLCNGLLVTGFPSRRD